MIFIVDASVAIKWFVAEEPLREEALAILKKIKEAPHLFAVPELFFNEMLSVFCRLLSEAQLIEDYLNALQDLGMARLGNGRQALSEAIALAKNFGLTGYDAIYAANAKLVNGLWLTADAAAHRKIAKLGVSHLLGDVELTLS